MSMDFFQRERAAFRAEQRLAFSVMRPRSFMIITGLVDDHGPPPLNLGRLYTRHSLGIIEMERVRRLRERETPRQGSS